FSVTVKSFAVSPSMDLPSLSCTVTISTTSCELLWKVVMGSCGACCALAAKRNVSNKSVIDFIASVPHPHRKLHRPLLVSARLRSELRARDHGVPTLPNDMVERIVRINPQIPAKPVTEPERPRHRRV